MSKIALSPNASGTGTLTIAAPNTNSNRTIDLPDAAGAFVLDSATQTLTNKTINALQLVDASIPAAKLSGAQSGSAPIYAARAWVNFNGTGTVAIRASGNVSSITDNGVGDYTVNFTTAMPDADYSTNVSSSRIFGSSTAVGSAQLNSNTAGSEAAPSTSSLRFTLINAGNTSLVDSMYLAVSVFR